ncbi:MAG: hypothetical protein ABH841_01860 [Candidatus Nealsonbacteria bacterium]
MGFFAPKALFDLNGEDILDGTPGLAKGEPNGALEGIPAGGFDPIGGLNGIPLCGGIIL